MTKDFVIAISEGSESSIGSNDNCHSATAPSVRGARDSQRSIPPITHKPSSNQLTPTSNKQKSLPITAPSSRPPPKSNKTAKKVVPPPPPPTVPSAALQIKDNAAGCEARQDPVGVTFSSPYGGGNKPRPLLGFTSPPPYNKRSRAHHSDGGATFSPARGVGNNRRYHPYLIDHQPSRRTVDFLSQMEAGGSAATQAAGQTPLPDTLVEWASALTLGNRRGQPVDLNLKLKMV